MKHLFYQHFALTGSSLVVFNGDKETKAILHLLAEEAVASGKRVLILSSQPEKYPIEGKVLVSPGTEMLMELLQSEEAQIIYLARKISDDILYPFKTAEIKRLLRKQEAATQIFMDVQAEEHTFDFLQKADLICTLNFNLLREEILRVYQNVSLKSSVTAQNKIRRRILELLKQNCPCFQEGDTAGQKILFIAQIKTLLDENVIIPVGRDLKNTLHTRILYGSVNHYQIKEI